MGSTAPPCFFVGQLSPSGGRRLALALPATSSVLPRGLGCALGRARSWLLPRLVGILAGGAGERNPLRFWPGVGVVCPEEDCSPDPLERGIQAWNASLLFCCSSNLAAIVFDCLTEDALNTDRGVEERCLLPVCELGQ